MRTLTMFVAALLLAMIAPPRLQSQTNRADTSRVIDIMAVNKIARRLIAPCCWSETADAHRSEAAMQMRAQIRAALERGFTEEQIMNGFVKEYGERVLSTPKAEGFNYMAWIMPGVALLLGVGVAWRFIRRAHAQSEKRTNPIAPAVAIDEEYAARVEKELKAWE